MELNPITEWINEGYKKGIELNPFITQVVKGITNGIKHSDKTGPLTDAAINYLTGTFAINLIHALPVISVVGISVYALCSMFSKKLAKLGAIGVFIYGVLVIL